MTGGVIDQSVIAALDDERRAFFQTIDERRLGPFRGTLQASVRWASPLALSFARHLGLALDDVLQVMTPPPLWPQSTGPLLLTQVRWTPPTTHGWKGGGTERMMRRVVRAGGHAIRIDENGSWVGWRVSGDTVEVAGRLGSATLLTNRGRLRMWVPHNLPAVLCDAMSGRQLASLVDHPYLAEEELKVLSVDDHRDGGHVLRVRAGKRYFAAPWPGLLAGIRVTHAEPSLAARYAREA